MHTTATVTATPPFLSDVVILVLIRHDLTSILQEFVRLHLSKILIKKAFDCKVVNLYYWTFRLTAAHLAALLKIANCETV